MNGLYAAREQIMDIYRSKSNWIIMVLRFILSLCVLFYIRNNIGYMTMLNKSYLLIGIALLCSMVPLVVLALISALFIVLHTYTVSLVISGIVAVVFFLMFIIYLRFSAKQMLALIIIGMAMAWNIPFAIPVVYGLLGSPAAIVPMAFGVIVYYMLSMISELPPVGASLSDGIDSMIEEAVSFTKELAFNKEMLLYILVFSICLVVVWGIRQLTIDHAWKYAVLAGALSNVVVALILSVSLDVEIAVFPVLLGSILAAAVGLVVEFLFLSVDYTRTEYLEYEDDEYHYYVKAVPIISVAKKEKTVKRINDNVEDDFAYEDDMGHERRRSVQPKKRERKNTRAPKNPEIFEEENTFEQAYPDATTVINSEHIEQELRNNAAKNEFTSDVNERNSKVNMEILREAMKKELDL